MTLPRFTPASRLAAVFLLAIWYAVATHGAA